MRGLTVDEVAAFTRLSSRVLRHIEAGDFAALPAGLQGRAHLRAYARAVGLDPEEVVATLGDRVPAEPDPLDALRARERRRFAADHPLAALLTVHVEALGRRAEGVTLRILSAPGRGTHLGRRLGGALIDAGILAGVIGVTLAVAAGLTHSTIDDLWRAARWPLTLSCGLMVAFYFSLSQSLGGRSTGTAVANWLAHAIEHRHAQSAARRQC